MKLNVVIHSDGACHGNPGPGGWAAVLVYGEQKREICGGVPATTNNRMELQAAIEALRALQEQVDAQCATASEQRDPENKLYTRMLRRRLDWESWRDAILSATGQIDLKIGGPASSISAAENHRRSLYGASDRQDMDPMLRIHDVPDPDGAARAALAAVEMDPDESKPVDTYSKGMRQRVKVAQALVNGPSVIMADEPLNGLDPRQRLRLIEIFQRLGAEGRCVIISSHVLDEVERFGSRVLVVAQGRLAAEGDFRGIRELMDDRPHLIRVRSDRCRALVATLIQSGLVSGARLLSEDAADVSVDDVARFRRSVAPAARHVGAVLTEVSPLDDDLESVFRYLVGAPGPGGVS